MKKKPAPGSLLPVIPADYFALLDEIKQRVHRAQVRASLAANGELIALYWDIGHLILARQSKEGWGTKVIDRLSRSICRRHFPDGRAFPRATSNTCGPLPSRGRTPHLCTSPLHTWKVLKSCKRRLHQFVRRRLQ